VTDQQDGPMQTDQTAALAAVPYSWLTFKWLCIGWSDVTVMCGHIPLSMLWGNTAYCVKLRGEDIYVVLFEWNWISWLKKMSALSLSY